MEKRSLAVSLLGGTRERLLPGGYHAPNGEPLAQYRTRDEGVDGARSQHSCSRGHRPPWRRPRDPPEFRRACGASSVADRSARKGPRAPHDMTARTPGTCGGLPHEYVAVPAVVLTVRVREHTTPAIGGRYPNQGDPGSVRSSAAPRSRAHADRLRERGLSTARAPCRL